MGDNGVTYFGTHFSHRTVEAVDGGDLPALVVSSEQDHLVRPADLKDEQQSERLQAVVASIHKVALFPEDNLGILSIGGLRSIWERYHEYIARIRHRAAHPEELEQVPELPVDIAADGDRGMHRLDVGFLDE